MKDVENNSARSARADVPPSEVVIGGDDVDELNVPGENDLSVEDEAVRTYNEVATKHHWPKCAKLSRSRRSKLRARLRDCGGLEGWRNALAKAQSSKFLRGETTRTSGHENWRPTLDFFLQETSFLKLTEGGYGADCTPAEPPADVDPVEWYAKQVAHGQE
jgi:hypothetical protein